MAERRVLEDFHIKFLEQPQRIREELFQWFNSSKKVNIFVTGKTGVGKSTLVNGLLGEKVAKEGDDLDPETSEVTGYEKDIGGIKVTVWDSPGLQDGTTNESRYLEDVERKCKDMDICIYCASMIETRFTENCGDIIAMQKLTNVLGKRMWDHALFILTFSNLAEDMDSEIIKAKDGEKSHLFQSKLKLWKTELTTALIKDVGVNKEVANQIEVVPAGYATEPALLDRDHWLSPLWFATLYAMHPRAQPAMMKLNARRIVNNPDEIRKEDLEKFLHEQPIIFSKRGAIIGKKYGQSEAGGAIGHHIGEHASVECIIILELHSLLSAFARALGITLMDMIKVEEDES